MLAWWSASTFVSPNRMPGRSDTVARISCTLIRETVNLTRRPRTSGGPPPGLHTPLRRWAQERQTCDTRLSFDYSAWRIHDFGPKIGLHGLFVPTRAAHIPEIAESVELLKI